MSSVGEANPFQLQEALSLLEATPVVLCSLLERLPQDWLYFREDPGAWNPCTVLIHLIHNERTNWIPRVRIILSTNAVREFPPFHQLPEQGEPGDGDVVQLLAQFAQLRQESLSFICDLNLAPDQLSREAEHPSLGTVNLGHLFAAWVVHDLNHLHQITKSLAKRYQASVGPWRGYIAILDL